MQTNNELPNQRWLLRKWQALLNLFSYENRKRDLDFGIGLIFWFEPKSILAGFIVDLEALPDVELSVLASPAISTVS